MDLLTIEAYAKEAREKYSDDVRQFFNDIPDVEGTHKSKERFEFFVDAFCIFESYLKDGNKFLFAADSNEKKKEEIASDNSEV